MNDLPSRVMLLESKVSADDISTRFRWVVKNYKSSRHIYLRRLGQGIRHFKCPAEKAAR
jgi:hypothetical protein